MFRVATSSEIATEAALGRPAVRAKFLQLWLSSFERFDASAQPLLLAKIGRERFAQIMEVSMLHWVSIEIDVEIVDAIAQILGKERFHAFTHDYVTEILPRAPLGALVDLGMKMIGLSPESFLRWWDKGWRAVYRDCGSVKGVVTGERRGSIVYERLPRVCVESEAFVAAIISSALAVLPWTGHDGEAHVTALRADEGYLELSLAWCERQ